ncbi:flagellar hook assembly protein FlgD [Stakelama sp. CBK3Z-3]|uniref:Basal-body rod modification protein FlgD n=1 Tax=Stakelama flava TaxID=2860338 RepID=A0ABS6XKX4_9SPHN|nr:flagellar hook capping FlgD N-terminal domain-containing protein [Stakelama flava]MBW4330463.1 flagellar hook assembly protein FlgD [Stakelama flava]
MTTAISATSSTTGTSSSLDKLTSDKTMFLQLLTTQMQNQDPLDPMDTSEYTQQLVQFSQVEQAIQQNTTLSAILDRLSGQDLISASSLVGKTASFDSNAAGLAENSPAQWSYTTEGAPAAMTATVSNAAGVPVAEWTLDNADGSIAWDGEMTNGATAPEGVYTLSIAASDTSGNALPVTVRANAQIDEATMEDDGVILRGNGAVYSFNTLVGTTNVD